MFKSWVGPCVACHFSQADYQLWTRNGKYSISLNCPACELLARAVYLGQRFGTPCPQCSSLAHRTLAWRHGWVGYYVCERCGYVLSGEMTRVVDELHRIGGEHRMVARSVVEKCLAEVQAMIEELRTPSSDDEELLCRAERIYYLKHIEGLLRWLLERGEIALDTTGFCWAQREDDGSGEEGSGCSPATASGAGPIPLASFLAAFSAKLHALTHALARFFRFTTE